MQKAVIIFGPPGAGKGTQAEMFADAFGFLHLETSRIIEEALATHDSTEYIIAGKSYTYGQEKENFDKGILVEPEVVVHWMVEAIRSHARAGKSIVFSGSPRTLFEAEHLYPVLHECFGGNGFFCFHLTVPPDLSVSRNMRRRICVACRLPHEPNKTVLECTRCRGSLVTRGELDSHTSLRKRLEEFEKRTLPGIYHFEDQGRAVSRLDGSRPPDDVFRHLCALLGLV